MKPEEFKRIQIWFEVYVRSFADGNGQPSPYQLKIEHSHRVARDARGLACDLGWFPEDVTLTEAIGLLHDVGRFSQFAQFGTFCDAKSVNHGTHGAGVLQQTDALSGLDADTQACILDAVSHHNAKTVPDHLDQSRRAFVQLIRDADKLDIFHIVHTKIQRDGFQELTCMLPQVRLDAPVSPQMVQDCQTRGACLVEHVASLADHLLLQLSWVYDINYVPTFRRILDRGIIDHIAEHLSGEDPAVLSLIADAKRYVHCRVSD